MIAMDGVENGYTFEQLIGFIFFVLTSNAQDTLLLTIEKFNNFTLNQNITIKQNTVVFNLTEAEHKIQIGKALPIFSFGVRQYTSSCTQRLVA